MFTFRRKESQMLKHVAEIVGDRMHNDSSGYEPEDESTVDRIERLGKATERATALVVTGEEQNSIDAHRLMTQIVEAELDNWVPNASQRLLHRASAALGVPMPDVLRDNPDCGAEPGWHALVANWAPLYSGGYVRQCVTCGRLYRDGTQS